MPKTIAKALQNRLLRSHGFRQHLQDLHLLSGTECIFLDDLGIERMRFPRTSDTPLRQLMARVPELRPRQNFMRQALLAEQEIEQKLPWREQAQRIWVEGETIGFVLLSAWRESICSGEQSRICWIDCARQGATLSWAHWQSLWLELPEITKEKYASWQRVLQLYCLEALRTLESETGTLPASAKIPPLIREACQIVQDCYDTPLTLQKVAAGCGVSAEHLSRQFHSATGLRFRDYLAETRVHAVCRELRNTRDSISEIAGRAGFSTLSRFNRTFRAVTGRTPREWRKHPPPF